MMSKIFESLLRIQGNYHAHAQEMEAMVVDSETLNQQYQDQMEATINAVCTSPFIQARRSRPRRRRTRLSTARPSSWSGTSTTSSPARRRCRRSRSG
jgi:hypothetical protein